LPDSSEPINARRAMLAGLGGLAAGAVLSRGASAGPVLPTPGSEPRTVINQANTPGDGSNAFVINQPGSYCLDRNLVGQSGKNGVLIAAPNVTIDLMGFTVQGVPGSLNGIKVEGVLFAQNHTVRNGIVDGWGENGVVLGARGVSGSLVAEVIASNNGGRGISVTENAVVRACIAIGNGGDGFTASDGAVFESCSALGNGGSGIVADTNALIRGNSCSNNINSGILVVGTDGRVEGNNCTNNYSGINVVGSGNFIVCNTCAGNTAHNWEVLAGNVCFVVNAVTSGAVNGDSGGVSPGTTSPWANFTF
jgi:hypothetical protein